LSRCDNPSAFSGRKSNWRIEVANPNEVGYKTTMAKQPEEVFTPRSAKVNADMYVRRPELESALAKAIKGSLNIVMHGQSGCGKSWLYKQVLEDNDAVFLQANLSNAARLGSITAEIKNVVSRRGEAGLKSFSEGKSSELNIAVASADIEHTKEFDVGQMEPFEHCLQIARKQSGEKSAFLVLDNLEFIFGVQNLMDELASLITLLDDERYSQYRVKLVVVGVPGGLRSYYNRTGNRSSVANRLFEIPEVSRLERNEARELVVRGLETQLGFSFEAAERDVILDHIIWVTDRIPQRVHEYCLDLAKLAIDARRVFKSFLPEVDKAWLSSSLSNVYGVIENWMNERETKIGRRNQLLYSLGKVTKDEFRFGEIEAVLRAEFPESTSDRGLNTNQMLGEFCGSDEPILKNAPKGDGYMFADPKFRLCIRVMLKKDPAKETVERVMIDTII
jgi:hypothetical protein